MPTNDAGEYITYDEWKVQQAAAKDRQRRAARETWVIKTNPIKFKIPGDFEEERMPEDPDPFVVAEAPEQEEPKPKKKAVYTLHSVKYERGVLQIQCQDQDGHTVGMNMTPVYDTYRYTRAIANAMSRAVSDKLAEKGVLVIERNRIPKLELLEAMYQFINVLLETNDDLLHRFQEQWVPIKQQFDREADGE